MHQANALADRIVRAQILMHESLVHDRQLFRAADFRLRKLPARQKLYFKYAEIAFAAKLIERRPFF